MTQKVQMNQIISGQIYNREKIIGIPKGIVIPVKHLGIIQRIVNNDLIFTFTTMTMIQKLNIINNNLSVFSVIVLICIRMQDDAR